MLNNHSTVKSVTKQVSAFKKFSTELVEESIAPLKKESLRFQNSDDTF